MSVHASEVQLKTASGANEVLMGEIEYELPYSLGILTLQVPLHWVGARGDAVEVLWVDQNASPFKDNVTLTIRAWSKVADPDELLDKVIDSMVNSIEHSTASDVEKTQGRRLISLERAAGDQEITQTALVIYAESADKSYILMLNHSRPASAEPIDLRRAKII